MNVYLYILLSYGLMLPLCAEPWGKDADLAYPKECCCDTECCSQSFVTGFGERMVKFHQQVISPADGPRSHYIPSSSQYTINAMRKYGFCQGVMMGCDRLMRENNDERVYRCTKDGAGNPMKYDPVP